MKIVTVVGARPQFIKAAALSRELRKTHNEILVHTGQHFDHNMSDVFFEEMNIPKPDYNLGISGGSHAEMTGQMMMDIEKVLIDEAPDALLVFGDTNSTLAAALAAVKLHVPVIHVEAGNRVGTLENPEEVNRICTDHVSKIKFASVESAMRSLEKENISDNAFFVGNIMYDAFLYYKEVAESNHSEQLITLDGDKFDIPEQYIYMTCHRQENTQNTQDLIEILSAVNEVGVPVIYPVHPRNRKTVEQIIKDGKFAHLVYTEPLGYLDSIYLENHAFKIVTDSGGVQTEAFFAKKQCVTILDFVCWPETMVDNCNQLAKADKKDILEKLNQSVTFNSEYQPFGDGKAAEKICKILDEITL